MKALFVAFMLLPGGTKTGWRKQWTWQCCSHVMLPSIRMYDKFMKEQVEFLEQMLFSMSFICNC